MPDDPKADREERPRLPEAGSRRKKLFWAVGIAAVPVVVVGGLYARAAYVRSRESKLLLSRVSRIDKFTSRTREQLKGWRAKHENGSLTPEDALAMISTGETLMLYVRAFLVLRAFEDEQQEHVKYMEMPYDELVALCKSIGPADDNSARPGSKWARDWFASFDWMRERVKRGEFSRGNAEMCLSAGIDSVLFTLQLERDGVFTLLENSRGQFRLGAPHDWMPGMFVFCEWFDAVETDGGNPEKGLPWRARHPRR